MRVCVCVCACMCACVCVRVYVCVCSVQLNRSICIACACRNAACACQPLCVRVLRPTKTYLRCLLSHLVVAAVSIVCPALRLSAHTATPPLLTPISRPLCLSLCLSLSLCLCLACKHPHQQQVVLLETHHRSLRLRRPIYYLPPLLQEEQTHHHPLHLRRPIYYLPSPPPLLLLLLRLRLLSLLIQLPQCL